MSKMIKTSRALGQYLHLPASAKTVYPMGPWGQPFTLNVCGLTTGDNPQYIFGSGANPPDEGALNCVLRTSGSLPYTNKLQVYGAGVSTPLLQSEDAYANGIHHFMPVKLQRDGAWYLELWHCPPLLEDPTDGSAVSVQATYQLAADRTFNAPAGIYLGAAATLAANRMSDQAFARMSRVDGEITKLQFAKYAYGAPLRGDAWYSGETVEEAIANGFEVIGTPTEVDGPDYPYTEWGTYEKFFGPNSYWNSTPVGLTFGTFEIPRDYNPSSPYNEWYGTVSAGAYSTKVCPVYEGDQPMTVYAADPAKGIKDSDSMQFYPSITLPRWNDGVVAAVGSDGHCDIYDTVTGVLANFWVLKKDANGRWTSMQVTFTDTKSDSYGWPNGGQYSMGARSAGVPSSAGSIRSHEVGDGQPMYNHALACSLSSKSLTPVAPGFIAPAGMADNTYYDNRPKDGIGIPLGALLMLPPGSDARPSNAEELKLQNSLLPGGKGARVTDRNTNTPIVFYVENGGPVPVISTAFMARLRPLLRQVTGVDSWINGDGQPMQPENPNLISLRGPYSKINGATGPLPTFNSTTKTVDFPQATASSSVEQNGGSMTGPEWFKPKDGKEYILEAYGAGDAKVRFTVYTTIAATATATAQAHQEFTVLLAPGESYKFTWKTGYWTKFSFAKPFGNAASIGATLKAV